MYVTGSVLLKLKHTSLMSHKIIYYSLFSLQFFNSLCAAFTNSGNVKQQC